jgi:hypothetical protein
MSMASAKIETKMERGERVGIMKPNGPAAAAILSAGAGTFTIGLVTSLAEAFAGLRAALVWYGPSGPLSGKTGVAIIVWLVVWAALASVWRGRNVNIGRVLTWTFVLLLVGFLGTFPPIFEAFAP